MSEMIEGKQKDKDSLSERQSFHDLVYEMDEWIWEMNTEGIYTHSNLKVKDLLGYSPAEMIGKSYSQIVIEEEAAHMKQDFSRAAFENNTIEHRETIYIHRDGSKVKLNSSKIPMTNFQGEFIGFWGRDREIAKESAAELKKRLLLETSEASSDFIAITDLKGHVIYYNRTARNVLGMREGEVEEHDLSSFIKESNLLTEERIATAINDGIWRGDSSIIRKDGLEVPVSQTIVAHKSESGDVQYFSIIARNITEIKQLEKMMNRYALYDSLTELPNRRHLYKTLTQIRENPHKDDKVACFFIDLDGFKEINDEFGHHAGDEVLKITASRLQKLIRNDDFVCRYAGDEFVIILNFIDDSEIKVMAKKTLKSLKEPFMLEGKKMRISGSIGVSLYVDQNESKEFLIKKADQAMYEAKRRGRGAFSIRNR